MDREIAERGLHTCTNGEHTDRVDDSVLRLHEAQALGTTRCVLARLQELVLEDSSGQLLALALGRIFAERAYVVLATELPELLRLAGQHAHAIRRRLHQQRAGERKHEAL
jgi:hypothetical protein